jgi:subfamily B ATP-binding cassette protein MsbA
MPYVDTQPPQQGLKIYKRLVRYALQHWQWLTYALIGLVIGAATEPLFASLMEPLMDGAFLDKDPDVLAYMPFAILLVFLARGISTFISGYYMTKVGRTVVKQLRSELFDQLLHVPISYFDTHPSGQLLAKLTYHVEQVAAASTQGLTVIVRDTLTIIGLLGLMFYQSWQLTLGLLLIVPVITLIVIYVSKRFRNLSLNLQKSVGDITQIANETIGAQREVRIFDGETYEKERFEAANHHNWKMHLKNALTDKISTPLIQFMIAIALSIIIYIATQASVLETLTPGKFTAFIMALILLLTPVRRLTAINSILQKGIAASSSIFSLLDEQREQDTGTKELTQCKGNIRVENISFRYNSSEKEVLSGLSMDVKAGEKYAFVGKSGSGKTTFVNLLPRFYDYQQGTIYLDDIPITELSLDNLRQQFAYVSQNITLFNDTVRNNIAYGHQQSTATDEDIRTAAQAAHALEFIEKMPQGLDTLIGDDGILLSGGQRQRIAIARAILSNAPILILDEAPSALDTESERHIQAALVKLLENRTTFIIAHRLSTIEEADCILVLDEGKVVESGSHTELLAQKGRYHRLHQMQFSEQTD